MKKKLLWICLLNCCIQHSYAEDSQNSAELNKVESGITTVKENMERLAQQKEEQQVLLADIEQHYGETAAALKVLHLKIEQKRKSLANIRLDMQVYQEEVKKLSQELAAQIRAAYAMGQQETLKLMLSQKDPALSHRMMAYFNAINKERLRKLKDLDVAVLHLQQLDQQKQDETQLLEQDLEQKKLEQMALDADRQGRSELLIKIGNDFTSSEYQLSQLQTSENRLKVLMESLPITDEELAVDAAHPNEVSPEIANPEELNNDFSALQGKLPWPVQGRVTRAFGSPRLAGVWDGVLIDAEEGREIKAVSRGKVAYAGELRGYGLLTIIDHGNEYMTLYAFSQSLYKHKGDVVDAGDVIASVGLSGGHTKAGLYFGLRKDGIAIDPSEWCQR